ITPPPRKKPAMASPECAPIPIAPSPLPQHPRKNPLTKKGAPSPPDIPQGLLQSTTNAQT
ncbi:MAG TPA: hypothetical protein VM008_16780, partial [Phycisphaerae bacterium]|nr:hypothetical protein [Phycisphaerae bacterium]